MIVFHRIASLPSNLLVELGTVPTPVALHGAYASRRARELDTL
jgi:hypothetical protein